MFDSDCDTFRIVGDTDTVCVSRLSIGKWMRGIDGGCYRLEAVGDIGRELGLTMGKQNDTGCAAG